MPVNLVYEQLCPSCGREAEAEFILKYGVCRKCFLGKETNSDSLNLIEYNRVIDEEINNFEEFFKQITNGFRLWGSQRIWLKRLFKGENIAIIAPTGVGKTTLLISYAIYMSTRYKKKILFLSPTASLSKQLYRKINTLIQKLSVKPRIIVYDSSLNREKRLAILDEIKSGNYDILIVTNAFVSRKYSSLADKQFDIIIADDVDSILNSSKNIVRLLNLLGYGFDAIAEAKELGSLKNRLLMYKINGLEEKYRELLEKYIECETSLKKIKESKKYGQIIIASATGRVRGPYVSVFRELLELDVSGITVYGRDVVDSYTIVEENNVLDKLSNILRIFGKGGIILISPHHPIKENINLKKLVDYLRSTTGFNIAKATPSTVKKLVEGKVDLVIGSASYYGVSVRGIDSPKHIRYVVFVGTPCFSIELKHLLLNPRFLYRSLLYLHDLGFDVRIYLKEVSKILRTHSASEIKFLKEVLSGRLDIADISSEKIQRSYNVLLEVIDRVYTMLVDILNEKKVLAMGTIVLYKSNKEDSTYYALIPDLMTYIQASGRTSRLFNGVMTKGIALIIELKTFSYLIKALETKFRYYSRNTEFKSLDSLDIKSILSKIDSSRNEPRIQNTPNDISLETILLVVESPTKAKTVSRFFGKPAKRRIGSINIYEVPFIEGNKIIYLNILATRGHLFDLTTDASKGVHGVEIDFNNVEPEYKPIYSTIKRCRICGHQFTSGDRCPRCGNTALYDSIEVVNVLRKLAGEVDTILIGTDPDIEGEKIAYDVYLVTKPINNNVYRIEFHEITPKEIRKAIRERRTIKYSLVNAQVFRRVLDRWVGFSLSRDLWLKFEKNWLGAGRVQTPVLGWIVENYEKWKKNKCYAIKIVFGDEEPYLKTRLCIRSKEEAKEIHKQLSSEGKVYATISKVVEQTVKSKPPYTTDTLLYEASSMGVPPSLAMKILQELFESGLITYHRTDSTYISSSGIELALEYLKSHGLKKYFNPRHWGSKGTHEAIRPTYPWDSRELEKNVSEGIVNIPVYLTPLHFKIYDMIFKRFIASQMSDYTILIAYINVLIGRKNQYVVVEAPLSIVKEGANIVTKPRLFKWLNKYIKEGVKEIELPIVNITMYKTSTTPLLDQGTVVKLMKERGLGRPSTYAKIIQSIKRHGYAIESKKRKYLIPTKTGLQVYDYLTKHYSDIVSEDMTRFMEKLIDNIEKNNISITQAFTTIYTRLNMQGLFKEFLSRSSTKLYQLHM